MSFGATRGRARHGAAAASSAHACEHIGRSTATRTHARTRCARASKACATREQSHNHSGRVLGLRRRSGKALPPLWPGSVALTPVRRVCPRAQMPMPMGVTGMMRPNMVPPTPGYPPRQQAFQPQLPPGGSFMPMAGGQTIGQAMYAPAAGYAAQAGRAVPGGPPGGNMYAAPPSGAARTPQPQGLRPIATSGGNRPVVPGAAPPSTAMAIPGKGAPLPGTGGPSALAQSAAPPRKSSAIQIVDPSTNVAVDLPYAKPKPPEGAMALAPGVARPRAMSQPPFPPRGGQGGRGQGGRGGQTGRGPAGPSPVQPMPVQHMQRKPRLRRSTGLSCAPSSQYATSVAN